MKLSDIKGLKEKRIEKLNSAGIFSPEELILHFPHSYIDTSKQIDFKFLKDGEQAAFIAYAASQPLRKFIRKGLSFVKVKMQSGETPVTCTWFNQPYLFNMLKTDKLFCLCGKVKKLKNGQIELVSPSISTHTQTDKQIIPLYKAIKGLPQNVFLDAVKDILQNIRANGYFDDYIIKNYSVMPLDSAIRELHFPASLEKINAAQKTVTLEKLSYTISVYNLVKKRKSGMRRFFYTGENASKNLEKVNEFIKNLPYELTADQKNAVNEIFKSLQSEKIMNRLIQGDVGSGKTVVAYIAMYYAALNGYQSVLMAPTEILAKQHYANAVKMFEGYGISLEFLSGSQSKQVRDNSLFNIKNGVADIVIGTHSLIQDSVTYKNLALVITDEQHRFGVAQRGNLENKSAGADSIVMSATPIPRTLALTIYGDLEQSKIVTMPKNKAKIHTRKVPRNKIADMLNYIKDNAQKNLQTYIVCQRIEEDDEVITSAQELYKELLPFFTKDLLGLIHGKMKEKEKTEIMNAFAAGNIKILVATTIIEVGIDVKNAVNMVIYDANRLGLSQLHQLRGRVGRGTVESYCFLVENDFDDEAKKRLDYFSGCSDGFELAEFDFVSRGAGDFLGTRQHGMDAGFSRITPELLKTAKEISDYLLNIPKVAGEITEKINESDSDYIKSLTLN